LLVVNHHDSEQQQLLQRESTAEAPAFFERLRLCRERAMVDFPSFPARFARRKHDFFVGVGSSV